MKKLISLITAFFTVILSFSAVFAEGYENEIWKNASDWAFSELNEANDKNLIPDVLKGTNFTENISREEFASLCVNAYEAVFSAVLDKGEENPFTDTENEDVIKAYNAGFTTGISENIFSPDSLLTREQGATMLARIIKKHEIPDWSIKNDSPLETKAEAFEDGGEISDWAENSVYYMSEKGIVNGVGNKKFAPKSTITREASVLIVNRIAKMYEKSNIPTENPTENNNESQDENEEDKKESFTVAFIGGSLTEGGYTWIEDVKKYLEEKMPDKSIVTINAGIGGTMSDYGATRYSSQVLSKDPDLVFIEFSVNDRNQTELFSKTYTESMIRQSLKQNKIPSVVLLHAPMPFDESNSGYESYKKGIDAKNLIANGYKVANVDIYEYLLSVYKTQKKEKSELTFDEFLKQYYNKSGDGYDVHPKASGYKLYSEAIIKAFDENYKAMLAKPKSRSVMTSENSDNATATYTVIPTSSARMHYTKGEWITYSKENPCTLNDTKATLPNSRYWIFPDGIKSLYKTKSEQFGFYSKAKAVCLSYFSATAGMKATVYIDEKKAGTVTTQSPYHGQNYITDWITLPNDGEEHKVIFKVENATDDNYVFSFGCIYEKK